MKPVLYILMRTDMDSMNPGKAMAQASHASNQFVAEYQEHAGCSKELYNCYSVNANEVLILKDIEFIQSLIPVSE